MGKNLSDELKDVDLDLDKPSFEEQCRQNYPIQWKVATTVMWVAFVIFVSVSVFNAYQHAAHAQAMLKSSDEILATVVDVTRVLEDGEYTDYSVLMELPIQSDINPLSIDISEEVYEDKYADASEIPVLYAGPQEYNLKSRALNNQVQHPLNRVPCCHEKTLSSP